MINEEKCGRAQDHPAELTKRGGQASAGRKFFGGFYLPENDVAGPVRHVFGDAKKFAADMKKFKARQQRRLNLTGQRYSGSVPRHYIMPV